MIQFRSYAYLKFLNNRYRSACTELSRSGGTGRRVRLRSVWMYFLGGSSPLFGTKADIMCFLVKPRWPAFAKASAGLMELELKFLKAQVVKLVDTQS